MSPFFLISAILSFTAASAASGVNYFEYSKLLSSSSFSTSNKCGEVLNTTSGTISYKVGEAFLPNERCVWTVRSENATSYSIGVFEMGIPEASNAHQITIAGITRDSKMVQLVPSAAGLYNIDDANILIITFSTGASANLNNNTGFSLQYLGVSNGNPPVMSPKSRDFIEESRYIRRFFYPPQYEFRYTNNELTTLVFAPVNFNFNKTQESGLIYSANSIENEDRCGDHVDIYYFDITTEPQATWQYQTQLCDSYEYYLIPHKDMVLAVFQTNEDLVNFGFSFITPGNCL